MEKFAAIDFETANFNRSSVCSVGIVFVEDGILTDSFYSLIRPQPNFYVARNTAVHGLTYFDTCRAPEFPAVWSQVAHRLEGMPLVAHNSPFDRSCLQAVHEAYDLPYPDYPFYCTYRLSAREYPFLQNHQLHTVSAYCGYDLTAHHHALADAEACAHIAVTLLRKHGLEQLAALQQHLAGHRRKGSGR